MLDTESLMRVYGALLWSMGKVFGGAEVLLNLLFTLFYSFYPFIYVLSVKETHEYIIEISFG